MLMNLKWDNKKLGFARVDYLASVSGGGFTCTSLVNHIAAETTVAQKSTPSGWRNTVIINLNNKS